MHASPNKKACLVLFCMTLFLCNSLLYAQKVGIGINTPRQILHISSTSDSNLLLLDNRSTLDTLTKASLYFKTGSYYTGSIKAVGEGSNLARLAFYTYADADSSKLRERMTIRDNGNIGIGTAVPSEILDVTGRGKFTVSNSNTASVTGINTGTNFLNAGVRGSGQYMGVIGAANGSIGIGVIGYNNSLDQGPFYENGVGVLGVSNAAHGVAGLTTRTSYAGVYGKPLVNGGYGGWFTSNSGTYSSTLALLTNGNIRFTGIGEGAGKVLGSDANGNASWQSLPTTVGYSAYLTNDYNLTSGNTFQLSLFTEQFDQGSIFDAPNGRFYAPSTGLYLVSLSLRVTATNANAKVFIQSQFNINGNNTYNTTSDQFIDGALSSTLVFTHVNTRLLYLTAGQSVTVNGIANFLVGTVAIRGGNFQGTTIFSAHRIN